MNTNTNMLSRCKLALLAASQALLLAHVAPAQERNWLDPQIQYFDVGSAPVKIGYRRLAPDRNLMAVGWTIENTTQQKVEFYLDQTYYCGSRVVQERRGSLLSVKPGQTLRGARFGGGDIILWDDFFYGTRPSDQLRTGEVIDRVEIRVRWKDTGAAERAAEERRAREAREAAARADAERLEREQRAEAARLERLRQAEEARQEAQRREQQRQRDEQRRADAQERRDREAEQRSRDAERRHRTVDDLNDRLRRTRNQTEAAQDAAGNLIRSLQERSRREAEERAQEREEERRAEQEAEERRERRERRRLGIDE